LERNSAPETLNADRSARVIARLLLRIIILCAFSALSDSGFGRSFAALLLLSMIVCVLIGILRQERPFQPALTHWDEATIYGLLYAAASAVNHIYAS
jgi:hypothetical protein